MEVIGKFFRNRDFLGLLLANTILGAGMPMLLILSGLSGLTLAPSSVFATLPASLQTLAGLLAAAPLSLLMGKMGRSTGFLVGALMVAFGALTATQAMFAQNFALLCCAHFLMGAGLTSFQYFRFAAGEVVQEKWQPVAISLMLTSGLLAAIGGPQLFVAAKDTLAPIPFAGAYAALAMVTFVGILPLFVVRMPKIEIAHQGANSTWRGTMNALRCGPVRRAIGIGAVSQGAMMFLMIPTPLAMIECGFGENTASNVIRWHIVAMFAPSFLTGFVIQRFGAQPIAVIGLIIIACSAMIAAVGTSAVHFYGALVILGAGWNFGFIGATMMLAASVPDVEKAGVQGLNDTLIGLVSTICAFASGVVISGLGWGLLAILSIFLVILMCLYLLLDEIKVVRPKTTQWRDRQ